MKLAVIDIGSNSIKLLIAEATGGTDFRRLSNGKEPVRLGRETLRAGFLSDAAIRRAIETINRFAAQAAEAGVERIIAIATASVREADNAAEFVERVRAATGVNVEVLSGVEEARLIGLAAWQGLNMSAGALINIDIGGGSTEITLVERGEPARLFSVRVGAVRLTENFLPNDPPKKSDVRRLREEVASAFEGPAREMHGERWDIATGTSGTILALGEALRTAKPKSANPTTAIDDFKSAIITLDLLDDINKRLARLPLAKRREVDGISSQRAEIIIAGGTILEEAMRALGIRELSTTDWALREGVVVDRLREIEAERLPPVPDFEDPRLRSVRTIGARFNYEEPHARHVAHLAERIFDQTVALHKFNRHQRTLLAAAALLHDVGYAIAHDSHHKHSQYIIRHAEMTGFTETERQLVALIARYHRGALPKDRHTEFALLDDLSRELVMRLGGILRLAEALDRHHDARVRDVGCEIESDDARTLHLHIHCAVSCEREARAVEINSELFAQAFDCFVVCHALESAVVSVVR